MATATKTKRTAGQTKTTKVNKGGRKAMRLPSPVVPVVKPKAVAVALDVLKSLRSLKLKSGSYLFDSAGSVNLAGAEDLMVVVPDARKRCEVCLLGACLLSKAALYDAVPLDDRLTCRDSMTEKLFLNADGDAVYERLRGVFGDRQCALMETAFEGYLLCYSAKATEEEVDAALAFGKAARANKIAGDTRNQAVVRAVMTNVVRNGGVFKPQLEKKR